jgi:hypothetical protein
LMIMCFFFRFFIKIWKLNLVSSMIGNPSVIFFYWYFSFFCSPLSLDFCCTYVCYVYSCFFFWILMMNRMNKSVNRIFFYDVYILIIYYLDLESEYLLLLRGDRPFGQSLALKKNIINNYQCPPLPHLKH